MKSAVIAILALFGACHVLDAEPVFLSKQYVRCTPCHYSPTGGGLLTPYGRSLTKELSSSPADNASFLWGAFGDTASPDAAADSQGLQVGIDLRPAYLHFSFPGGTANQRIFMNADLLGAFRLNRWTLYGEVGRQPQSPGWTIDSYEYWASYQASDTIAIRAGRFLPAFGIRFADHTAFNRAPLGLDIYDQVYGIEVSRSTDGSLLQASISPGRAESILHDDGRRAATGTARYQRDLSPRTAVVVSGLFRDSSTLAPRTAVTGAALGFAPTHRLSIWTEGDAQVAEGAGGTAWIVVNETAFEAIRGVWLKVSPQLRTIAGVEGGGVLRTVFEANLLPRTHWNLDTSYYIDRNRANSLVTKTFLIQLHVYL